MMTAQRRLNPLTGEWVLVSPHRTQRPWLGQVEETNDECIPPYDKDCYLCPGNLRAEGKQNPHYQSTYVFDNDFPALLLPSKCNTIGKTGLSAWNFLENETELFRIEPEIGICRVMCFSPRHDLTLPELSQVQVEPIVRGWIKQTEDLGEDDCISYVQVFENKGAMMGCSNPHPHNQIWASGRIPNEPAKETTAQLDFLNKHGACLLCRYLETEIKDGERIITANEHFTALAPFWAVWPYEILLLSNRHLASFISLSEQEISALGEILRGITARYDNIFETSFPYSMGFHQAPSDGLPHEGWHFHAHYYPPLLRSANVRKFMVGYEMLGMPQRDLTAEAAAERLRSLSEVHYKSH